MIRAPAFLERWYRIVWDGFGFLYLWVSEFLSLRVGYIPWGMGIRWRGMGMGIRWDRIG